MVNWQKTCLISPSDVRPTRDDFEVIGTFNPGAIRVDNKIHLLVRIAQQPIASPNSTDILLPRYDGDGGLVIDRLSHADVEPIDARVVIDRRSGGARLTSVSYLRHFIVDVDQIANPDAYVDAGDVVIPSAGTETMGVEDPRITLIEGRFWFTYVCVSTHGACTSTASTTDFKTFQRHGVQFPNENKDVLLLPEQIAGRYAALHRPVSATPFGSPEMWSAWSDDLLSWGGHRPLRFETGSRDLTGKNSGQGDNDGVGDIDGSEPQRGWDSGRVGGGTVPVRCQRGWLSMFHGNARSNVAGQVGKYCGALMIGHPDDPGRVIATSRDPVFVPDQSFELKGFVPGVVFPTAWIELDDRVAIFYGAADEHTAVAIAARDDLLSTIADSAPDC